MTDKKNFKRPIARLGGKIELIYYRATTTEKIRRAKRAEEGEIEKFEGRSDRRWKGKPFTQSYRDTRFIVERRHRCRVNRLDLLYSAHELNFIRDFCLLFLQSVRPPGDPQIKFSIFSYLPRGIQEIYQHCQSLGPADLGGRTTYSQ